MCVTALYTSVAIMAEVSMQAFLEERSPMVRNFADLDSRRLDKEIKDFSEGADAAAFLETLSRCSLVVSNDGLAPHLAAHLGVPTVAIFGPGDPVAMRPLGRQHRVLSQHVDCSPCSASTCPLKHHRCLEELLVARVYEAVDSLLGDRAQAGPEG